MGVVAALSLVWYISRYVHAAADILAMGRELSAAAWEAEDLRGQRGAGCAPAAAGVWGTRPSPAALPRWVQPALENHGNKGLPREAADALCRHLITWAATAVADTAWRHLTA